MSTKAQLFARLKGPIQWECPKCGCLHGATQQIWRKSWIECCKCEARFRVGIGFTQKEASRRALFMGDAPKDTILNRIDPISFETALIAGRMYGKLEFECPHCQRGQAAECDFDLGYVVCQWCKAFFLVQMLLYRAIKGPALTAPFDWTVTFYDPTTPHQPLSAPKDGPLQ